MRGNIDRVVALLALALAMLAGAHDACAALTPTSATILWTAPGDDSLTGTAFQYDVRVSTAALDLSNFTSAIACSGAPSPQVAGTTQGMTVNGLSPATHYWCAMRTQDAAGNWSGISNVIQFTTPSASDTIRPAPITLALVTTGATSVSLGWNATGNDSLTGNASAYDLRWSTAAITSANWSAATVVTAGVPAPAAPGTAQSCVVTGLDRTVDLWFAIRARDAVNNWSALSNVIAVAHALDAAPPATPSGLTAAKETAGIHLRWSPNTEPDLAGYHVYRAALAGGAFTRVDVSSVTAADFVDASAPDSASLWYQVTAFNTSLVESGRSSTFRVWLNAGNITAVRLDAVFPNPSGLAQPVTIPLEVPPPASIDGRIDIVNVAGERVRTLELRGIAPGTTSVVWDGRNDAGRTTAPGVYRALLSAGGTQQAVKLVRR